MCYLLADEGTGCDTSLSRGAAGESRGAAGPDFTFVVETEDGLRGAVGRGGHGTGCGTGAGQLEVVLGPLGGSLATPQWKVVDTVQASEWRRQGNVSVDQRGSDVGRYGDLRLGCR